MTESDLLMRFRETDRKRCGKFAIKLEDWTPSDWATGLAGEVVELFNMIAKEKWELK